VPIFGSRRRLEQAFHREDSRISSAREPKT
jgi:hypothetical protein